MRLAALFALLPALAAAQDVPSLQRPNPALPITASTAVMGFRLGGPGGSFAAAQLALKGPEGLAALLAAKGDPDPLRRLDAAYGLGLLDDESAYAALAAMLGDPDPRVAGEATHGLRLAIARAAPAIRHAAFVGGDAAGDAAVVLLIELGDREAADRVALTPGAAGRVAALTYGYTLTLGAFEDAARDPRAKVRAIGIRRIVSMRRTPEVVAELARLAHSPDPTVRAELARQETNDDSLEREAYLGVLARDPDVSVRRAVLDTLPDSLYQPSRTPGGVRVLARLIAGPDPALADAALDFASGFVAGRLGSSPPLRWNALPPAILAPMRAVLVRDLRGARSYPAAIVLAALRDPRAYPELAQPAFEAGEQGAVALRAVGASGDRRATPHLLKLIPDPKVGDVALESLGLLRDPASVPPLVALLRRDPKGRGVAVAAALAAIGDRSATPALLDVARSVGEAWEPSYFGPLGRLGGPSVREYLLDRLAHAPETSLPAAGSALIDQKDRTAIPDLERIASASDRRAEEAKRVLTALRRR